MLKKHLYNSRNNNPIQFFFFLILIQIVSSSEDYAQAYSIRGKITASRLPVKEASVSFIDIEDTTRQYSAITNSTGEYQIGLVNSVSSNTRIAPVKFKLGQSYPNPFSSTAAIPYGLNEESEVQVTVYDMLGRVVRKFDVGQQSVGTHNILWDGHNRFGQTVASGIYFYRLDANGESQVRKMIFNQNGTGSFVLPGISTFTVNESLAKTNTKQNVQSGTFTVRIQNTQTTTPLIEPRIFENVVVQNDTTINFAVTSIALATIDFDSAHQIIRGYGAASPWYLPVMTDSEVESAFGMDDGQIGFSIFRITLENDSNRWAKYVQSAKKAHDMGAIIIASPWYAPSSMVEQAGNISRVRYDMYDEYAEHLNNFVKFMDDNGAPIFGVSIQNEPDIEENWTSWTTEEMFNFMKNYAHLIEGTNVMAPESFHFDRTYNDPILNDPVAAENTDIVCGHIYGGGLAKYPLAEEKGKEVWMTEYLMGENNSGNNIVWAIELAKNINDVMKADMSAYVWWTMVRYYGPIGDGSIASNPQDPNESYPAKGEVTKKGFIMSQFSRFIRPGFYRVDCNVSPISNKIGITAYKDISTSRAVIVAVNTAAAQVEQTFRIQNGAMLLNFIPYTTSESKNVERGNEISVEEGMFKFTLEPLSVTTFVSD